MKPILPIAAASLAAAALTAVPAQAKACACRAGHHHHGHARYVSHAVYVRPYVRRYAAPVYYRDYGYAPAWSYGAYYDWADPAPVWVSYGPDYGWYDGGWRWRHHHHWHDWDRGHWHGHGHWDHGWHRGWR